MKVIPNNIIPFKGFKSVNLFGVLFVRSEWVDRVGDVDINHESIHTAQMKELLYIGFYVAYLVEWLVRWIVERDRNVAYYSVSFEREAYANEKDPEYLGKRKHFAQWRK
jgi:hypothetical protein